MSSAILMFKQNEQIATREVFFCTGFITSSWAALIPYIKFNISISDSTLGFLLLSLGIGALVGMPTSGFCCNKYGCKRVLLTSVTGYSLLFPLLTHVQTPITLFVLLLMFGLLLGITDCAVSIQAVAVEKDTGKPLMSGFHGFYSLGGMAGATTLTLLLSSGMLPSYACSVISFCTLFLLSHSRTALRSDITRKHSPYFAFPKGAVILIGLICCIFFLAEGAVINWSGVFLSEYRSVSPKSAGMSVVCFSIFMTIGRLFGDRVVSKLGSRQLVILGTVVALSGFTISLSVSQWQSALIGFALIGIGCSNIVPIMFSSIGKQNTMPDGVAVTAVTTLAYTGVLAGPALIGFFGELYGLVTAFTVVMGLMLIAVLLSFKIRM